MERESVRNFESLLKVRPEDASLLNALGYSLADRNQKLPRAETLIRKALEPRLTIRHFSTAWAGCASVAATFPGALPYLERAYRIFPDAEIASHWGEAAVGQRQTGRGACLVGALAGTIARFEAAARHHRTAHRHEDGFGAAGRARKAEGAEPDTAPAAEPSPPRPPPLVRRRLDEPRRARRRCWSRWCLLAGCRTRRRRRSSVPVPTRPGRSSARLSKNSTSTRSMDAWPWPRTGRASRPACATSNSLAARIWRSTGRWASAAAVVLDGEELRSTTSRGDTARW